MKVEDIKNLIGNPLVWGENREVHGVASIFESTPTDLTFAYGRLAKERILATDSEVIICPREMVRNLSTYVDAMEKTLIGVDNPRLWFIRIAKMIKPFPDYEFYTGMVSINLPVVTIGQRVTMKPGARIGFTGFGYEQNEDGRWEKFPHYGGVIIGDDVDIGSGTCIDRGTLSDTIIEDGVKIDNLVHVAHNAHIEENCLIVTQVCVAGSARLERNVWVGPGAKIRDGITVGEGALVGMGAIVIEDVEPHAVVVGNPAKFLRWRK